MRRGANHIDDLLEKMKFLGLNLVAGGGFGTEPVQTWDGGNLKGRKVRLFAEHIRSDMYSAEARAVTSRIARTQKD